MRIAALLLAALTLCGAEIAKTDKKIESKLRDVARLQGVRSNQLLGYGMVVVANDMDVVAQGFAGASAAFRQQAA